MALDGIPILGEKPTTRGWLSVVMTLHHDNQSKVLPDRTVHVATNHWILAMQGIRSDNMRCVARQDLKPDEAADPAKISKAVFELSKFFHTYLNCACSPHESCPQHMAVASVT